MPTQTTRRGKKTAQSVSFCEPRQNTLEVALASMPFFGGDGGDEAPGEGQKTSNSDDENGDEGQGNEKSGSTPLSIGGDDEKPLLDNDEIRSLLSQVKSQTKQIKDFKTQVDGLKANEDKVSRAQRSKEENLQADLDSANATIDGLSMALQEQALINAITANGKHSFHSIKHVIREIDLEMLEFNVDLNTGVASVKGVDAELKRVVRECSWLVKEGESAGNSGGNGSSGNNGGAGGGFRPTGTPPASGGSGNAKQTRREQLIGRFPVIAHGVR